MSSSIDSANFQIYTDGSKMNNKTGAAFAVFNSTSCIHSDTFKLSPNNSVFQAEIFSIMKACEFLYSSNKIPSHSSCIFYSDSLSAVNLLNKCFVFHDPLSINCLLSLITLSHKVRFCIRWCKGRRPFGYHW